MSVKDRGRRGANTIPPSVRVSDVPYKGVTPRQTSLAHAFATFRPSGVQAAELKGWHDAQDPAPSSVRPGAPAVKASLFRSSLASVPPAQRSTTHILDFLLHRHELWRHSKS